MTKSVAVFTMILVSAFGLRSQSAGVAAAPHIFYSDLESGPNTGGEKNGGAYVTIYGNHFGATQGASTVTVGGGAVSAYPVWSDNKVTFQLGAAAVTGNIVISVNGAASNGLPFTVRPGTIHFVAVTGSDTGGAGTVASPWATIRKCKNSLAAGDICYVMNGVVQSAVDGYSAALAIMADMGGSGTAGYPKALIAYPGASAQIGTPSSSTYGVRISDYHGPMAYWTIAGFNLRGINTAASVEGATTSNIRIVGNNMQCPNGNGGTACVGSGLGVTYLHVLGNEVTNAGIVGASKLYHSVYFGIDSNHIEAGWNYIHDNHSCRGIQFHSTSISSTTGYNEYDLDVHDNVIRGQVCDGLNFATVDPSKGAVRAYNNIIYSVGRGPDPPDGSAGYTCIYVAGMTNNGTPGSGSVDIYNNTLYDCGSRGGTSAAAFARGLGSPALYMSLKNNIIYQKAGEVYFTYGTPTSLVNGSHNVWYGAGAGPTWLTANVNADPQFINLGSLDFHLAATSPAIDAGVVSNAYTDADGVSRPQGTAFDIGAYEFPAGGSTAAASLAMVALSPAVATGGSTTSANTVTLSSPAPAGGAVVTLTSSSAAASVPASVTIPAGATSAPFSITTSAVAASTAVTVSATFGGITKSATLTLVPVALSSVTLYPASVGGGSTTTRNAVYLNGAAPAGGAVVTLTSSSAAASVPASVTVPAGATSAPFSITTSAVTASTAVTVSATFGGITKSATLTLVPVALSSVALYPASVGGGSTTTRNAVYLNGAAPAGGAVVTLTSSSAAASVPASVTIPAGATSAPFSITTSAVAASTAVTVSATFGGITKSATLTLVPEALSSVALYPASVGGGSTTTRNAVYLNGAAPAGGAVVTLTSSSAAASVPASVTVPAGATSAPFSITTSAVAASTAVTVSATFGGVTKSATLTLVPVALSSVALYPASVGGGSTTTRNAVYLNGAAPAGGAVVTLTSSSAAASVPASVTVPAGATSAPFSITTSAVAASTAVTVSATFGGITKSATLTLVPVALSSVALYPASVGGGSTTTANVVYLNAPAPAGGAAVTFSNSSTAAGVPASVTVPAGATSAKFTITTSAVAASTPVTISATSGGVTKSASLTVTQ